MLYEPRFSKVDKLHYHFTCPKRLFSYAYAIFENRTLLGTKIPYHGYIADGTKWNFSCKISKYARNYKYMMRNQVLTKPKTLSRFLGLKSYI